MADDAVAGPAAALVPPSTDASAERTLHTPVLEHADTIRGGGSGGGLTALDAQCPMPDVVHAPLPPPPVTSPLHQPHEQGGASMVELLRPMFPLHDYDAGAVMASLLDTLVQGPLDMAGVATIRSPLHAELLLFGLLPQLPTGHQLLLLDTIMQLFARRLRNRELCGPLRLTDRLAWLLSHSAHRLRPLLSVPAPLPPARSPSARSTSPEPQSPVADADGPHAVTEHGRVVTRLASLLSVLGATGSIRDLLLFLAPLTRPQASLTPPSGASLLALSCVCLDTPSLFSFDRGACLCTFLDDIVFGLHLVSSHAHTRMLL